MNPFNYLKSLMSASSVDSIEMAAKPVETIDVEESIDKLDLSGKEEAISEASYLYNSGDFTKYNPDDLIGRKGVRIYKRMMLDEQVKAGIKFKKDAILSRGYFFNLDAAKTGLTEEEVERRISISNAIVEKMEGSYSDSLLKVLTAFENGFSMTEIVGGYFKHEGKLYAGVKALKKKEASTFKFNVDEYSNVLSVHQDISGKSKPLDLSRFIHYTINPDVDEHYGESELRSCYRHWFSKDHIIKFRNIYLERFAGGFSTITPPKGVKVLQGTPTYEALAKIVRNTNTLTGVVLPESGYEFDLKFPQGSGASDSFSKAIESCDMAIARALLVPPLLGVSPQGDTGSYSQSETQLDAFFWTLIAEANRLADCLNEQLFKPLGWLNFGDEHYPKFSWKPGSLSMAMRVVKAYIELIDKKVLKNTEQDEIFIRDALSLPAVKEFISNEQGVDEPSNDDEVEPEVDEEIQETETQTDDEVEDVLDESVIGKSGLVIENAYKNAFKRAHSRVNFARIGVTAEGIVEDNVNNLSEVTDKIITSLISSAKEGGDLSADLIDNYKKISVNSKLKQKLNKEVTKVLKDGNKLGTSEASKEIDKAMKKSFSLGCDKKRLDFIAEDYFKVSGFRITGNLVAEMEKLILDEILNGARYSKTFEEVETSIYEKAAKKGLISYDQAVDALGEAFGVDDPSHRLRTITRTSTFDAINTARDAYFTDPQLGGFVRAFEYSSILDSATTEICRHLDEDNAGNHSVQWYSENQGFKPPNHFNCRSLLIAVTANDLASFTEGPTPNIQPQEGFS